MRQRHVMMVLWKSCPTLMLALAKIGVAALQQHHL